MGKTEKHGWVKVLEENIDRFAGEKIRKKVTESSDEITEKTSEAKIADWVKGAMERLDALVDEETRIRIMENCGYNCAVVNKKAVEMAKARRKKYETIDEFLDAEQRNPMRGTRLVSEGKVLYQFYAPSTFAESLRCYCSMVNKLPANEQISRTFCYCSKGFVEKLWEAVLEKPVRVELIQSVMSGAQECKFAIHL